MKSEDVFEVCAGIGVLLLGLALFVGVVGAVVFVVIGI